MHPPSSHPAIRAACSSSQRGGIPPPPTPGVRRGGIPPPPNNASAMLFLQLRPIPTIHILHVTNTDRIILLFSASATSESPASSARGTFGVALAKGGSPLSFHRAHSTPAANAKMVRFFVSISPRTLNFCFSAVGNLRFPRHLRNHRTDYLLSNRY